MEFKSDNGKFEKTIKKLSWFYKSDKYFGINFFFQINLYYGTQGVHWRFNHQIVLREQKCLIYFLVIRTAPSCSSKRGDVINIHATCPKYFYKFWGGFLFLSFFFFFVVGNEAI